MGAEKEFYQRPVDRTAYGSCVGLAAFVGLLFLVCAYGIWNAGQYVRQHWRFSFSLPKGAPTISLPSASLPADPLQAAKDAAAKAAQDQLDKAADAAKDAAASKAQEAIDQAANQIKEQAQQSASSSLNDFLKP